MSGRKLYKKNTATLFPVFIESIKARTDSIIYILILVCGGGSRTGEWSKVRYSDRCIGKILNKVCRVEFVPFLHSGSSI